MSGGGAACCVGVAATVLVVLLVLLVLLVLVVLVPVAPMVLVLKVVLAGRGLAVWIVVWHGR